VKIAVASAGLSLLADRTVRELGADMAVANELAVSNGRLTGEVRVKVSIMNKPDVIREIARGFNVSIKECAVIGDYRYDIPEDAGLKIAFNPKDDEVQRLADVIVESSDLKDVLNHLI
jgi:phosphoserine phosphatase